MKETTSTEIRKQRDATKKELRDAYQEMETLRATQREAVAGSRAYFEIQDRIETIQAKTPILADMIRRLEIELAALLTEEAKELHAKKQEIVNEISPKLEALFAEMNAALDDYSRRIVAMGRAVVPKEIAIPDLCINVEIRNLPYNRYPKDNAISYLTNGMVFLAMSKTSEAQQLTEALARK